MEQLRNITGVLDLMIRPAFCIKDGLVAAVNRDAQRFLIQTGMSVESLLPGQEEEFRNLRDGCLYVSLLINGQRFGASVTVQDGYQIVVIEQEADQAELNAMALAAQELREPLSNVLAVADQLFPVISADTPAQDQVARINRGLFQMLRVISNMSDAARYHQQPQGSYEVRNVTTLFDELFRQAGELIGQTGIRVEFQNLRETIYSQVDAEKLERAVYNILSNAVKFTPRGGIIEASLIRRNRKLYLTVQDSGTGVDPNLRGRIHTRYLRHPGIEDGRFGIGLGRVLLRSAAAAHGGTVLMEHPEGRGARITMSMEIRQDTSGIFRTPMMKIDYAGERDHGLIELSDALPAHLYRTENVN